MRTYTWTVGWVVLCTSMGWAARGQAQEPDPQEAREPGGAMEAAEEEAQSNEVQAREEEMFGEPAEGEVPPPPGPGSRDLEADRDAREEALFGAEEEAPEEPRSVNGEPLEEPGLLDTFASALQEVDDRVQIGGQVFLRLHWTTSPFIYGITPEGEVGEDQNLSSPNLFDTYVDARLTDRLRAYARGRFRYDPTVRADSRAFGQPVVSSSLALDQLWLKFDLFRFAYFTVGQQPIRWGASRFWNPTDFMNQQRLNPLAVFDERLGVNLVKVHIPVESLGWNFYVIGNLEGAADIEDVGVAVRGEFLFEQTEVSVSAAYRHDDPVRLGIDLSSALWWFDVRLELAALYDVREPFWAGRFVFDPAAFAFEEPRARDRSDQWILQGVAGAEIAIPYNDENDSVILGAEYFYNDAGYHTSNLYPWLLLQGQFNPLYVGRHYVAAYAVAMGPGTLDDTTFLLSWLGNVSDGSYTVRFDYRVTFLTYLSFNAYVTGSFGNPNGSFRFGQDPVDFGDIPDELLEQFGLTPELARALERGQPPAEVEVGIGLRVQY